jgi:hypothetical protein
MKMVKSLLLGSAAGLVAIAGAQAADLPVKAKPVEYVKVCTVYGVGFYYIPGTDTCLKVGGYVRMDIGIEAAGSHGPYYVGGAARENRADTPYYQTRTRGVISFDARSQTEWGTLRAFIRAGWEMNSSTAGYSVANGVTVDTTYRGLTYWDRAFIQFAGLTVGKTQSFFDFYANALNYVTSIVGGSDTGHGINLLAYTFQFGGGFSGTVSLEDTVHRRTGLWDATTSPLNHSIFPNGGVVTAATPATAVPFGYAAPFSYGDYAAQRYPDVVANLRVDQPWGSAQVMAALHDASGACYGANCGGAGNAGGTPALDATGWAVGAGVMFNLPWAQGDQFWIQGTYAEGAASYLGFNKFVANDLYAMFRGSGAAPGAIGSATLGWAFDGIFQGTGAAGGTPVALTEGFQINAAVQHYWTPSLRTSVFGGYAELDFGNPATVNSAANLFCTGNINTGGVAGTTNVVALPAGCDPSFAVWQLGSRTIWSPVRNMDIGVEVLYTSFDQNMVGNWNVAPGGGRPAGLYTARDQDVWSGLVRFQRNFWP